jgi:branched-chain amino acid transport system substrate-binding protein
MRGLRLTARRLAGITLAATALALAAPATAQTAPIRIGSFLAVTGPASFLGDPELKTLQMLVDQVNADGGVLGRKVELVHYDSGGDAEKARTFAKRLIEQDKVDVIVGGSTTGETMAAVPLVEQAGMPFVSLAGAVVIVEPVKKWVFKTPHTDRMACDKIFVDMKARGLTRVALISGSGGFDKSMRAECLKVAPNHGVQIVADETYGAADTDMTAQLTKIKGQRRAGGAQRRLRPGPGDRHAQPQAGRADAAACTSRTAWRPRSTSSCPVTLPKACGCPRRRCWWPTCCPRATRRSRSSPPTATPTRSAGAARSRPSAATPTTARCWSVNAVKAAGGTDKAKVRDALEATRGYVGTGGVVNMSPTDHMGLDLSAFRMLEVKGGTWSLVN